jgi:hypothetical protein
MKTIRIAAGAGYAGDRIEPALENIKFGNVEYIIFETLAERTIALAQKEKLTHPDRGYNPLLDYRMGKILPLLKDHPVKIITNMGAANPIAAAKRIHEIACHYGLEKLKIAAIMGDDVLDLLDRFYDLDIMETGKKLESLKDRIISANAYIGAEAITKALAQGADIVVTGRVADPALVSGPLMYELSKEYTDYDFLGKTLVAGHLLECAGQVTGGYYADPGLKDVPELWDLPFPILTFSEDGKIILEKLPNTGGLLNACTVKEQLLYEIQDPANYFTPDAIVDFSQIRVAEIEDGRVEVLGASGKPKSGTLKVTVGYTDGFIGEGEISYGGHNCVARAKLAEEVIMKRFELLGLQYGELRTDFLGLNSLYASAASRFTPPELSEVRLRVAIRSGNEESAEAVGREIEALYVNGPAGGGGARSTLTRIVSVASVLIPENEIDSRIIWEGDCHHETV